MTNLSLFQDEQTWVHRLDGRTKILCLLGLFCLSLVFSDPVYLFGLTLGIFGLVLCARCITNLKKIWILLALLFVYNVVLWPFFVEGTTPLWTIAGMTVMREGIFHGMGMGLRLNAMLISGIILLSTTAIEEFAESSHRLGVPRSLGFAVALAFRWVPNLLSSIGAVIQAQRSRGLDLKSTSLTGKIRQYPALVVPLIGHTLRQTNLLAMALESKGFGPGEPRRPLFESHLTIQDYCALVIMSGVVLGSLWMRMNGYGTI
ncbi:energy-coupling factor transporter transmembrane component T [Candidatus Nitronereus thalassa]|uniref:Energy-coupling factor transporter transmembrane component T n=1 Tax=Candidatus Nitronereus thalassa TaxID=3020898 RepID=A0ABU3K7B0_9BACT|nr:energy-coupling factor transporter transmembrane component T [Candidatus Nitronereus thalassa]MDT7042247.1 energy-coupling factor transporter transmembrane component T [Candidatus Nitronereus thalassa]